ncbi:MAG: ATP synthase F1 subunit delta [Vulcanimicrobiaceae bacterium]
MASETVARRYAAAAFELAAERAVVEDVAKDLHALAGAIYADESAKAFFLSPVLARKEKIRVLSEAFAGRADDVAVNLVLLLVRKRREALLREIVAQYDLLELASRGAERLTVTSAKELAPERLRAMVERLERIYLKKFDVTQTVDPRLIGGVRITMGDRRIDGSVAGRLDELSRTLFARN